MRTRITVPENSLTRLRIALTLFFALDGFVFAGWVVRIPAIKEQTGASAGALAPSLEGALLGYAVTGIGLANLFPVAIERAGALAGPSGVATASTLGYGGMLLGPPMIGFLADWFSLPTALTTVAALAAVAAVVAYATRNAARPGVG